MGMNRPQNPTRHPGRSALLNATDSLCSQHSRMGPDTRAEHRVRMLAEVLKSDTRIRRDCRVNGPADDTGDFGRRIEADFHDALCQIEPMENIAHLVKQPRSSSDAGPSDQEGQQAISRTKRCS